MLELDQILRANELSISLVAAVPALLMSWTLLRGMWTLLLVRAPPDARREAAPCRWVSCGSIPVARGTSSAEMQRRQVSSYTPSGAGLS